MPGTLPRPRLVVAAPAIPFLCHEDEWTGNLVRLPACLLAAGRLVGRGGGGVVPGTAGGSQARSKQLWRQDARRGCPQSEARLLVQQAAAIKGGGKRTRARWSPFHSRGMMAKQTKDCWSLGFFWGCGGDAHKEERRRRRDSHHHFFESFFRPASASVLIRTVIIIYT